MISVTFTLTCDKCGDWHGYSDVCDAGEDVHPIIPNLWKRDGVTSVGGKTTVLLLCPACAAKKEQEVKRD